MTSHNKNLKHMAVIEPRSTHTLSLSVPNVMTIGRHLTSFVTCATFNM